MDENRIEQQNDTPVQPEEAKKQHWWSSKKPKEKKSAKQEIKEWVVALAVALIVVLVIQGVFFRIIRVDGQSMETTLHNGERLYVDVMNVRFADAVPRGSVVICNYPNRYTSVLGIHFNTYFVKRVVGVPGDTVYRADGINHVVYEEDGKTVDVGLEDDVLYYGIYRYNGGPDYEPYVLGENEYFVVGDNRGNSHDSRDWQDEEPDGDVGPITKNMIVGRVREVIWPLNSIRAVK